MTTYLKSVPTKCSTAKDRAAREAATNELFAARAASSDPVEQQVLLERIVELNLEIARGIAQRFRNRGAETEDLEQVAFLGLMKAATNYRLDAEVPFIGYAVPTIRGEVKRYFRDCAWTVRIPRRLQELQGKISAKLPELEQLLGREPSTAEIAAGLDLEQTEVEQAMAAYGCFTTLSLDRPAEEGGLQLADVVPDEQDSAVSQLETVDMLQPLLEDLGPRDRRILELRFVENWNQSDIGREVGVSQMQVSRLLKRILTDLRQQLTPLPVAA
ncbi:SigB/SigF/SigG family RNA polymerase sigma factor [Kribbella sandramycini]|uniref:RNA polymerase sigma-B factor n=1 Tax=Kribbella sandramycini TaxID=60450 RepID=A0A7Y4L6C4_9ACTN|nr:SigB/SigF/SigG family RNA polymerase sigma factor [Kribbella sandramycini]MBB6570358.1 RNA polymerase sigma-B factor [Kribbella sandramycini]NOL45220.1 SigB/SigF/SigG family RNA polymerase sigma factor [Kribbella sandramycini]